MAQKYVNLNLNPLRKYRKALRQELLTGTDPNNMLMTFGRRYLAFLRDRFRINRAGGGEWPHLKPETILRTKGQRLGILHVTGAVFNALRQGQPGNLFKRIQYGVRVGLGGPAKHPNSDKTIAQIGIWHDQGTEHVPQRRIIVPPDAPLLKLCRDDAKRTVEKLMKNAATAPTRTGELV
jgi:hypothetical protein